VAKRIAEVLALPIGAITVTLPTGTEAVRDGDQFLVRERSADVEATVESFNSAAEAAARLIEILLAEPDDAEVEEWFRRVMAPAP